MRSFSAGWRSTHLFILQLLVVLIFLLPFVSGTFRDNDQAAIVSGAWQVARHETPFFHGTFYNFDKQWGTFLALTLLYRSFPRIDPVLLGNILLGTVAAPAWLSLGLRMGRTRRAPPALVFPILLSPALLLYMPFLGTGWMSLAWLLLAFYFLGRTGSPASRILGVLLVGVAAACRGDVVLAVPALGLSLLSRRRIPHLFRSGLLWSLLSAAVLPVLFGKWLAGIHIPDTNPLSFDSRAYAGFFLFGFTPALLLLLTACVWFYFRASVRHRIFFSFYALAAIAPLIPLTFYSLQLYTLRYFFLTIASLLFSVSSRRSAWLYRQARLRNRDRIRQATCLSLAVTLIPWVFGLHLPTLHQPGLTLRDPTRFPTGDGVFPMGGYLGFAWQERFRDHLAIDHNQKIWQTARHVPYVACASGAVPFLITPMSNFIELAIRLQGKLPLPVATTSAAPCSQVYADARSLLRSDLWQAGNVNWFRNGISFARDIGNGQLILRLDRNQQPTTESVLLDRLHKVFGNRAAEVYLERSNRTWCLEPRPGTREAIFANGICVLNGKEENGGKGKQLWVRLIGAEAAKSTVSCEGGLVGWARTSFPDYLGL